MGTIITIPFAAAVSVLSLRPGDITFWCKWILSYTAIKRWRHGRVRRFDRHDAEAEHDPCLTNFIPFPEEYVLESPLSDEQLLNHADEVFLYGVSSKSESLIARVARGPGGSAKAWILLKTSDGRTFALRDRSGSQLSGCDRKTFTCGPLQMHYISPMRRWRIFFNGMLREENTNDSSAENMVHVKFSLIWIASSDVFDFRTDIDARSLASGLAKATWNQYLPPVENILEALDGYAQSGVIMGTMTVDGSEEQEVYLFGERARTFGQTTVVKSAEFQNIMGVTLRNGRLFHLIELSMENLVKDMTFGFMIEPSGSIQTPSRFKFLSEKFNKRDEDNNFLELEFNVDETYYNCRGKFPSKEADFQSNKGWDGHLTIDCVEYELNGIKGNGIVLTGKVTKPSHMPKVEIMAPERLPSEIPLVVKFSEKHCQLSDITGGKGSSLGKLTELSQDLQSYSVPNGFVVTTAAYDLFVTEAIVEKIKDLENVLYGNKDGDPKVACQRLTEEVIQTSIPDRILQAVIGCLQETFKDSHYDKKFAIRSSATGEDTEQMSAAGQMETYLGVSGISEIMSAVKKCWASQFSFIAVQYKRQNGQVLNSPMAVVIQQMVPCDVAGVLFTCDPLTGNPTSISITANYGLGESVVSGSEEPDTLEISRTTDGHLEIRNKLIGAKHQRTVMKGDSGTVNETLSEEEKSACCLSDSSALHLAQVALKIESSYRSRRDIEWGFWNNTLYIFQSRPVTSGTGETDFEIDHEMDAPMRCEEEFFTVCNVGEVMPGALSPLGADTLFKYFRIVFQRKDFVDWQSSDKPKYFPKGIIQVMYHAMFFLIDLMESAAESPESAQVAAIAMFGRKIDDEETLGMARERYAKCSRKRGTMKEHINRLRRALYIGKRKLAKGEKRYANYRIPVEKYKTSTELFDALLLACTDPCESLAVHMVCSESSSVLNMTIFTILQKAAGGVTADVYTDFAKLLTTCSEVESADVPAAIEDLAHHIGKDINPEDFKKMEEKEAKNWLATTSSLSGKKYNEFIKKHGHRCLKEFDIRSKTWETDPKPLILLLQNLVGSDKVKQTQKKDGDITKILDDLSISLNWKARLIFKWVLPLTRGAVQRREKSKSLLIRAINGWRKGYKRLAELMVSEGRIPDEDLLYFMQVEEIKELLETRSPKIIAKANHRRRRYPILDKYIFPEIMKGIPKPINVETPVAVYTNDDFSMKGIPVSQGIAKGIIRVALDLDEASHLQPGEILVTYSTDIGWSPYFPILGGVVTELGGLISHGAVVSREYGLPCVAGMHGATQQFRTGDYAMLDGNKGILQKISKED